MVYKFTVSGRLPSLNDYADAERAHRQLGAEMKRIYLQNVMIEIYQQLRGVMIKKPVKMAYLWVEPNRKRDKDNISSCGRKIIQDALVQRGVLQNDGWNWVVSFHDDFAVDREKPRVEVTLEEVMDE